MLWAKRCRRAAPSTTDPVSALNKRTPTSGNGPPSSSDNRWACVLIHECYASSNLRPLPLSRERPPHFLPAVKYIQNYCSQLAALAVFMVAVRACLHMVEHPAHILTRRTQRCSWFLRVCPCPCARTIRWAAAFISGGCCALLLLERVDHPSRTEPDLFSCAWCLHQLHSSSLFVLTAASCVQQHG